MKRYIILILILNLSYAISAQDLTSKLAKNSAYVEFAGSGLLYSVNYDRLLLVDKRMRFSGTVGFTYLPTIEDFITFKHIYGASIGFNTLFGTEKHFGEFGINLSYLNMTEYSDIVYHTLYLPLRLGYRYQKDTNGLFLRLSVMPIFSVYQHVDAKVFLYPITLHFGVGVGYSF